jgi:hypothetical protein
MITPKKKSQRERRFPDIESSQLRQKGAEEEPRRLDDPDKETAPRVKARKIDKVLDLI